MPYAFELPPLEATPTPAEGSMARTLADKLNGQGLKDVEMICEELDINPTLNCLRYLDRLVWKCKDCDHYTPTLELDANETCFSCR